mgnify:CR=1 FL=1
MKTQIDHLVVMASSLQAGVQWCEDTLGITPAAGGEHEKYGTHNRLFKIATPNYPLAYFEIIAINPAAVIPKRAQVPRWFDMDDKALQKAVADGPRLIHFVSSTDDIKAARHALRTQGIERGQVVHASRKSSKGTLNWQITVRDDGQRQQEGIEKVLQSAHEEAWARSMFMARSLGPGLAGAGPGSVVSWRPPAAAAWSWPDHSRPVHARCKTTKACQMPATRAPRHQCDQRRCD